VFREKYLLPNKTSLSGVIVGDTVVIVIDTGTTHIGSSGYCGATCTTGDDFGFKMVYGYKLSLLFGAVGFLSASVRAILRIGTLGRKALSADLADMLRVMR
jgi:hypothetical protein